MRFKDRYVKLEALKESTKERNQIAYLGNLHCAYTFNYFG